MNKDCAVAVRRNQYWLLQIRTNRDGGLIGVENGIYKRIVSMALRLEPNLALVMEWLHTIPISRLGDQTAIDLVCLGQGDRVIEFLSNALREDAQ